MHSKSQGCFSKRKYSSGVENYINSYHHHNHIFIYLIMFIWVRSWNCGCLVTWFCYQLIAKSGNKTAAVSWPDPYANFCPQTLATECWNRLLCCFQEPPPEFVTKSSYSMLALYLQHQVVIDHDIMTLHCNSSPYMLFAILPMFRLNFQSNYHVCGGIFSQCIHWIEL